jgi:hypothetical protein
MYVTDTAVWWSQDHDRHEDLISMAGARDDAREVSGVRVEIVPPGGDYRIPLDRWKFRVDQDDVPDWWDEREAEIACRKVLPEWAAHHIHREGHLVVRDGQTRIVLDGSVDVTGGKVWAYGSATVQSVTGGVVWAYGSATVQSVTGGEVRAYDSATVQSVTGGDVVGYGSATVQSVTGGVVWAYGSATVQSVTGGEVVAHDSATVQSVTGGDVWVRGSAQIINDTRNKGGQHVSVS